MNIPGVNNNFAFLGVLSDQPITAVQFQEDSGGDDISIADFSFVIPEPCTVCLLVLGSLSAARVRKR